ncbi:MAG TPA: CPXCG motif-containing cysteine-rich protein [Gemmatimonadota bacterium]|nr:CPXCG motif-containing cysteine-rich protein [Gemmatimonadota bacterium]
MDVPPIVIPPATGPLAEVVFPESDGVADTAASVLCPWCGERFGVALDPGSGAEQEYVEDCETCCRPILLEVRYTTSGKARVEAEREE